MNFNLATIYLKFENFLHSLIIALAINLKEYSVYGKKHYRQFQYQIFLPRGLFYVPITN